MDCLRSSAPLDAGLPSSERFLRGRLLGGRYLVEQMIGAGAMGRVYRARHLGLGRACAVKVIHERVAAPRASDRASRRVCTTRVAALPRGGGVGHRGSSGVSERSRSDERSRSGGVRAGDAVLRFHVEALAASRLDHPNIVRVLDFGCEPVSLHGALGADAGGHEAEPPSLWYLVTEHLDGEDLIDLLNATPILPPERIVSIMRQLCSALQHAHDAGVIHRDIKPENIRLVPRIDDDGAPLEQVKLLDFGTAKLLQDEESGAFGGAPLLAVPDEDGGRLVIGTPAYMSPEQAAGQPVDARSDVYACGVLLFEMATGRLPFERPTPVALAAAHVESPPPRPSALHPSFDPDLEALILQCLRKNPDDRPQSARALREALAHIALRRARSAADERAAVSRAPRPSEGARPPAASSVRWRCSADDAATSRLAEDSAAARSAEDSAAARSAGTSTWVGYRSPSLPESAHLDRPCSPPTARRDAAPAPTWVGHRSTPCPPASLVEVASPPALAGAPPADAPSPPAVPSTPAPAPASAQLTLELDAAIESLFLLRPHRSSGPRSLVRLRRRRRRRLAPVVIGTVAATVLGGSLCLLFNAAGAALAPLASPSPERDADAPPTADGRARAVHAQEPEPTCPAGSPR
ncbi:protein kinase domain-containing protein [Sorangium sp. So ce1000]|uniref:serine/threonine-protein kinase n=1 Tax=Sorangium sp. So ce1000 TaxID=3133325 RepID=UPI003F5DBC33